MKKKRHVPVDVLTPSDSSEDGDGSEPDSGSDSLDYDVAQSQWDVEQDYEQRPRKIRKLEKQSTRLPIKTAEGEVKHVELPEPARGIDEESDLQWSDDDAVNGMLAAEREAVEAEKQKPKLSNKQQIVEAKIEIARIATLLNEEPEENIGLLRKLHEISESPNATVRKLAIAAQAAVYKDLIPGYRIRPLSEEEQKAKVTKDIRRVRTFEQSLVTGYQIYIRELAALVKGAKGENEEVAEFASLAITCACTLLKSVPHFNFRGELLAILVGKLSLRSIDDGFIKCRETLEEVFRDDEDGNASLDAVRQLTRMMKAKDYRIDESVLNTLLQLRLLTEFSSKASQTRVDDKPDGEKIRGRRLKKEKSNFRTKKQRKIDKERRVVEKEFKQADATVSHEERDRMQAETLKLVFVTYFQILKQRIPALMGAVLEGLAKYAHLINQDFFGDLLEALKDLVGYASAQEDDDAEDAIDIDEDAETQRNATREALLCIITAFALLQGQAESLALDLSFFTTHLYQTLLPLSLNPDIELSAKSLHLPDPNSAESIPKFKINVQTTTVLLLRCLSAALLPSKQRARTLPPARIAAFTKRIMTSSLHLPEKSAVANLALVTQLAKTHKKIGSLWRTEERISNGVYRPEASEAEGSNPFAATIWEGEILRMHFSPRVREMLGSVVGAVK